ncbi:MAG: dienelactone hydrolase family protein [Bryobacterales bacterium]|jgi:dienelactone hydrolase|nr:dienelactone hydrolase family protein [Bryobacterales bacterium]
MMPLLGQVPKTDVRNGVRPNTDTAFQPRDYTRAEWDVRREELKQRVLFASGLLPMPARTPLNAQVFGRIEGEGYTIEKVLLETLPGFFLGGNLYRPAKPAGKVPAILHPHGHWTYGRLENQPLYSAPTFGINMARQGFVVFAYDMVGYNDTPQTPHRFTGKAEQLWQFTPLGLQTWNSIRALDFLEALPDVDPKRIGATGASGGGTQTFLLAAIDERVAAAAPVNMVSLVMQGGCICENAPHLRVDTQNVEIAALTAPRPQLIVAATGDWTRNVPTLEFPAVQKIYALYAAANQVEHVQFDAPHNFHKPSREAVYAFFRKVFLGGDGSPVAERGAPVPDARDLLVLWNQKLPSHARSFPQLFEDWRAMSDAQAAQPDLDALRTRLAMAVEAKLPARVEATNEGLLVILSAGNGDRVPLRVRNGSSASKEAIILAHPQGSASAMATQELLQQAQDGATVYAPDLYQTGAAKAPIADRHLHHATFNLTDDAQRVQDLLTAVAYARAQGATQVRIAGLGEARAWAILAAAVSRGAASLGTSTAALSGEYQNDEWLAQHCFIPGLQRAGGIAAALRVLNAQR